MAIRTQDELNDLVREQVHEANAALREGRSEIEVRLKICERLVHNWIQGGSKAVVGHEKTALVEDLPDAPLAEDFKILAQMVYNAGLALFIEMGTTNYDESRLRAMFMDAGIGLVFFIFPSS